MANFKQEILAAAGGELIEAISIGRFGDSEAFEVEKGAVPAERLNQPVSWDEAAAWLDYDYDDGLGLAECHPIVAWTATRILFVHEYDGSTEVMWAPRHPTSIDQTRYL